MKFIDPSLYVEKNAELELEFNGAPIGLTLILRSKTSEEVKSVEKKYQNIAEEQFRKKRKLSLNFDLVDKKMLDLAVAHVAGWSWHKDAPGIGGQKPDFSEKSLRGFLEHELLGPDFIEQIFGVVEDKSAFLTKSA